MPKPFWDVRPPKWPMRFVDPVVKFEVHAPLLGRIQPWATLTFTGRRSGRTIVVPVRYYETSDGHVTFSPNAWRFNFTEPRPVAVRCKGRVVQHTAVLVRDPSEVARALNELLDRGLWVPGGMRPRGAKRFSTETVVAAATDMLVFS